MIALDTDVLIEIARFSERGKVCLSKIEDAQEPICITVLNLHEFSFGLRKIGRSATPLALMPVLDFTRRDALLSSKIEAVLEEKGTRIPRIDAMIAAICINNSAVLYTFDLKHFSQAKRFGLRLFENNLHT